jgi:hypothetical protein
MLCPLYVRPNQVTAKTFVDLIKGNAAQPPTGRIVFLSTNYVVQFANNQWTQMLINALLKYTTSVPL